MRALATLAGFEAYNGAFRSGTKRRPLAEPAPGLPAYVLVRESEEKGSDVNLATRLLVDGFNRDYQQAVVVSNDADFASAMRYVRDDLGLRVTLVNPDLKNASPKALVDAATYVKRLRKSHLRGSQFPDTLTDGIGAITKPAGWLRFARHGRRPAPTAQPRAGGLVGAWSSLAGPASGRRRIGGLSAPLFSCVDDA